MYGVKDASPSEGVLGRYTYMVGVPGRRIIVAACRGLAFVRRCATACVLCSHPAPVLSRVCREATLRDLDPVLPAVRRGDQGWLFQGWSPFVPRVSVGGGEAWLHLPHLLLDEAPAHLYCPDESQAEDVALYGGGTAKPADCLLVAAITPAGAPKPFAVLGVEAPADPGLSEKQVCQPGISNNCFNDDVLCCFCCFHRSYFFATLLFFCSWSLVPRF